MAFLRGTDTPVGTFQATLPHQAEGSIAYIVFPAHWRKGYARELATSVVTHLFEAFGVPSLSAELDTRNIASLRLVESLGMTRVATTRGADFFKGASSDEYRYQLTRKDWHRSS